jgi:hypothetical protein
LDYMLRFDYTFTQQPDFQCCGLCALAHCHGLNYLFFL